MATTTLDNKVKINFKKFFSVQSREVSDVLGDMIVTVAVTGITLTYMFNIIPAVYSGTIPGLYLFGMLVQLFIRIVHRYDESYTVDEVGKLMVEIENKSDQQFEELKRTIQDEPGMLSLIERTDNIVKRLDEIDKHMAPY